MCSNMYFFSVGTNLVIISSNCNFGSNFTKIAHKESKKMFNKLSQHILDGKLKVDNTLFIGLFLSFITCEDTHYFLAVLSSRFHTVHKLHKLVEAKQVRCTKQQNFKRKML